MRDFRSWARVVTRIVAEHAALAIGVCALALVVYWRTTVSYSSDVLANASFDPTWRSMLVAGTTIGRADAPIHVVEFADFECPACARMYATLVAAQQRYGDSITITFVHFPLAYHAFAIVAARASECARDQQQFEPMYEALFSHHDSLSAINAQRFAHMAGLSDTALFGSCMARRDTAARILEGISLGKALRLRGTPTVFVNGWRFSTALPPARLDAIVRAIADRRARDSIHPVAQP